MPMISGTRLGPYEILSPIGAGGMGEVYKARDTRLNRVVAIKVLKDQFSERFEREARAVAALNHTNISQLYDVGPNYLVMEFVEGAPIQSVDSCEKLLDLAGQITDGLIAAHAAGIVHRDLKPGNILVTRTGQVKILDFGLAMMTSRPTDATSDRATAPVTDKGAAVGTVFYMSPEQARGQTVDARTDLWSLGVVLYEIATRVRPFEGSTSAVVFQALLGQDPVPVRERNAKMSPELERIIGRLLEKDRDVRYQSAADLRADLKRVERDSGSGRIATATPPPRVRRASYRKAGVAAIGLLILAAAAGVFYSLKPGGAVTSPSEYTQLTDFTDSAVAPSLSPDGRMVTFIRGGEFFLSPGQIYVKLLPNGESVRLTNDGEPKYGPVFTPDGSRIAYTKLSTSGETLLWDTWTVPVLGGQPTRFLPNASGLTWMSDKRVLFSEVMNGTSLHMGIVTATEGRAESREIYFPPHVNGMAHYSYASPDLKSVLVVEMDQSHAFRGPCRLLPFDGSSAGQEIGPRGTCTSAAWSPDGKWMYFGARVGGKAHLWRQKFPDGTPEQITFGPIEEEGVAVAPDGKSLVTSAGNRRSTIWIHDTAGDRALSSEGFAVAPRLSRDGTRVFYLSVQDMVANAAGANGQWVPSSAELRALNIASGNTETVLPGISIADYDISPDEKEVAYSTTALNGPSKVWLASLDRRTPPREIAAGDQVSFGADGELVFRSLEGASTFPVRIKKDGSGREPVTTVPILEKMGVSPDGNWVAAFSAGSTANSLVGGILAIPLHGGATKKLCAGDCRPFWSHDGRFLYVDRTAMASGPFAGKTVAIPIPAGQSLPDLPAGGLDANTGEIRLAGARVIERAISPGPDPSTYVFEKRDLQRNLFRIPLH
jgi:serine/threonine protein kinase/Tol biopolymer transport system component